MSFGPLVRRPQVFFFRVFDYNMPYISCNNSRRLGKGGAREGAYLRLICSISIQDVDLR